MYIENSLTISTPMLSVYLFEVEGGITRTVFIAIA